MAMMDTVRSEMMAALKAGDKQTKDALSALLAAMKKEWVEKRENFTDEDAIAVVAHEVKQLKETIETAPSGYEDVIEDCKTKIAIMSKFLPEQMSEEEIRKAIDGVLLSLNLTEPTAKEKGIIMKNLMPITKGKADGKLVNGILASYFKA
ncbi:MAG: GatB/YqeY domain-containing protein [Oscillospiraceae bacterium]